MTDAEARLSRVKQRLVDLVAEDVGGWPLATQVLNEILHEELHAD